MNSRPEVVRKLIATVLGALCASVLVACGLPQPPDPPPFHCEDYDAASEIFFATCAEDAGDVEDDAGTDEDAGDVDGGP